MSNTKPQARLEPIALTAEQFSQIIGLSRSRVFEMLSAGQLPPSIKIGRARRWLRSDIERWLSLGCPCLEKFNQLTQERN